MAKRLIKIAKELNVGTSSIVDHLNSVGFEIENKPTAKISDEMYAELVKTFQSEIAVKEQADQLIIGTRPAPSKKATEEVVKAKTPVVEPKIEKVEPIPEPEPEIVPEPVVEEVVEAPVVEIVEEEEVIVPKIPVVEEEVIEVVVKEEAPVVKPVEKPVDIEKPKIQLNIKGKIDLDAPKEARKAAKAKREKEKEIAKEQEKKAKKPVAKKEAPEKTAQKEVTPPVAKKTEKAKPETQPDAQPVEPPKKELTRAETPQLKGLKILGKIDTDQFKAKKKKKGEDAPKAGSKPDAATDQTKKRRRKRKKVPNTQGQGGGNNSSGGGNRNDNGSSGSRSGGGNRNNNNSNNNRNSNRGGRGGNRRNDIKEVSKKEIDDKIKATLARLNKGGKTKRSKIRRGNRDEKREKQDIKDMENYNHKLQVTEFVSVSELANLMEVSVSQVITICMNLGVIVSINQRLDAEIIELVAAEFKHEVEFIDVEEQVEDEEEIIDAPEDLVHRSPIVTVMGHVDHGKTSLLDFIRSSKVADAEAGGITQHIGAYEVEVGEDNKSITFLDTPGHEAFTAMRARGAKVTDVAVIIVSADDSVMPQTKEAISHAQAAGVPIIFAINKIDKDGADPDRIKSELANMNLQVEEWGGKYQSQDISAKQGTNIDLLLEKILLEAEMLELKANPKRMSTGTVVEASLDKGRGYVTKMLVQNGTLHIGDPIVAGEHSGKIKAMYNEVGTRIKEAGPSKPVLVLGLSGAPQAGEKFKETETEQEARQIASKRAQINREQTTRASKRISLDEIGRRLALGTFKELNLIVKGDVDGSIEALSDSLLKLAQETVQVNIIHKAVGQIIESDVLLASASDAIIIGFQVRPSMGARQIAEKEGVQIKLYSIIYEAIEEIKSAIEGMLEPTKEEKIVSQVEIKEVYKISRIGSVAGCQVMEGKITRNTKIRVIRDGIVVYPTKEGVAAELASLKRFKEDVREVKNGMECGITIKNFNDIKPGDYIEGYEIIEIAQKLKD